MSSLKTLNQLQIHRNSLKFPKYALEENCVSSSHRAQDVENKTQAFIIKLAELQESWREARLGTERSESVWRGQERPLVRVQPQLQWRPQIPEYWRCWACGRSTKDSSR